jgi:hypothetical protein
MVRKLEVERIESFRPLIAITINEKIGRTVYTASRSFVQPPNGGIEATTRRTIGAMAYSE